MSFTDVFIRRPVFATALNLLLFLVGIRAFFDIAVREYPNISPSVINVSVAYPGASPEVMEGYVATPIENAMSGMDGLDFVTSSSLQGYVDITVQFKLGYDISKAVTDVSNAVSSVRSQLPTNVQDPVVSKNDPNSQPTIWLSFVNNRITEEALYDYLIRVVKPQLTLISGVAQAKVFTLREYIMQLWLDPDLMTAHGITPTDIRLAIEQGNVQSAAGRIKNNSLEMNINADTDLRTPIQFNNMMVRNQDGQIIRIRDVGHAELSSAEHRVTASVDGKDHAEYLGIIPQSTANPLAIAEAVHKMLPDIQRSFPSGTQMFEVWDSSKFISAAIREVIYTVLEACIFVLAVIYFFLGSLRAVIIPLVTIPLSLMGVCLLMLSMGFTINILTLLAWVLAIGLVVDDAIVVLENVYRHLEAGKTPLAAALIGTREIGFAIVAMTLTLSAVYAPIGFMAGLSGILFREFAFTLAGAVLISGLIALTLSPMMCSKLLRPHSHTGFSGWVDERLSRLIALYRQYLDKALDHRKWVMIGACFIYASCVWLYISLPNELAPSEDQGIILTVMQGPTSANIDYTERYSNLLKHMYMDIPERDHLGIVNGYSGVNSAIGFLSLTPWDKRHRTSNEIIATILPKLWMIPGVRAFAFNPPALPGTSSNDPVNFVLKTVGSYQVLLDAMSKLLDAAARNPKLVHVDTDLKFDSIQQRIRVDADKIQDLNIHNSNVADTLAVALSQNYITLFTMDGRSYQVVPQIYDRFRFSPQELYRLPIRTGSGTIIPFSNVAKISDEIGPLSLNHFQQLRSATLTASLAPGYTLGQALDYLRSASVDIFPASISYDYNNESRQLMEANGAMMQTFVFALIFIFLVLAAQFESFRNPLIVMVSVPLSICGALVAMHLVGSTMNMYAQIGLVTLIGLVSKHGILIVEFSDQLLEKHHNVFRAAVIEAASLRLRPILMTTAAMVLAAVPLALASGAGAMARRDLGWVIVGGMTFGTVMTLFVVPAFYTLLAQKPVLQEEDVA